VHHSRHDLRAGVKQGAYAKVVRAACKSGKLKRQEERLHATVREDEMIRLAVPTQPEPVQKSDAVVVPIRPAA
jgi:hypothetical protein